jgi:isocitrate lyase
MGAETVIVARTDAEAAKLIESNQDPRSVLCACAESGPLMSCFLTCVKQCLVCVLCTCSSTCCTFAHVPMLA